jgi:hydroxyacylglutathione hydrolase
LYKQNQKSGKMILKQMYTGCLAQGAYFIASDGEAAIVDPLRDVDTYLKEAEQHGVVIKYILETHFHADFVSGHKELADRTGATIVFGPDAQTAFPAMIAAHHTELTLGKTRIQVLHTPGHTPESVCYLLYDEQNTPHALFSGDTLFINDVGRPDLAAKSNLSPEDLASMLYDSLRQHIMPLPDHVLVYPAHGAGSACGKNMAKETFDTLGHQKEVNYALQPNMRREDFIQELTTGLLPPPSYFPENVRLNKAGAQALGIVKSQGLQAHNPEQFYQMAHHYRALILDTRSPEAFTEKHIPGAIFIGIDGGFAPWVGALIPDLQQPILLVTEEGREEEVVTRLSRVGYDHVLGFLKGGLLAWVAAGKETDAIENISAEAFALQYKPEHTVVLDVRKPGEYASTHVEGATSMPLDFLNHQMDQLPEAKPWYLHCAGGYRSVIAASMLKARGHHDLLNISGGFKALETTDLPRTAYVCPSTLK